MTQQIYNTGLDHGQVRIHSENDILTVEVNLQYIFANPELLGNLQREMRRVSTHRLVETSYTTDAYVQALPMVSLRTYIDNLDAQAVPVIQTLLAYISAVVK